jgi:hypothetical protein
MTLGSVVEGQHARQTVQNNAVVTSSVVCRTQIYDGD